MSWYAVSIGHSIYTVGPDAAAIDTENGRGPCRWLRGLLLACDDWARRNAVRPGRKTGDGAAPQIVDYQFKA